MENVHFHRIFRNVGQVLSRLQNVYFWLPLPSPSPPPPRPVNQPNSEYECTYKYKTKRNEFLYAVVSLCNRSFFLSLFALSLSFYPRTASIKLVHVLKSLVKRNVNFDKFLRVNRVERNFSCFLFFFLPFCCSAVSCAVQSTNFVYELACVVCYMLSYARIVNFFVLKKDRNPLGSFFSYIWLFEV